MTFLYFSYGSNLLRQRLQLANPSAVFVTTAQLKDHILAFSSLGLDPKTVRWRGGSGTIVPQPGACVWGCVWRLSKANLHTLDSQESVYDAIDVAVIDADSAEHACRTYQLPASCMDIFTYDNRPSPMYLDVIIRGAKQNQLPPEYVHYLHGIETNGVDLNCEVYNDVLKLLEQSS